MTFACTVALFCVAKPFGTGDQLPPAALIAFWTLLHAGCWSVGILCGALVGALRPQSQLVERVALTVAIAALPISSVVAGMRSLFLDSPFTPSAVLAVLPISAGLTLILAVNARAATTLLGDAGGLGPREASAPPAPPPPVPLPAAAAAPPPEAPPAPDAPAARILERLSPERRGALRRLSMQDHYVQVATDRGTELVLLRLGDAIAECDPVEGLQVHRSHWVARAAVVAAWRDGDRAVLELAGGERIPVSRGRVQALREAGWLPGRAGGPGAGAAGGLSGPEGSSR
ncbi:transcriptional regulator, LytTR family [Albimonas pacifica]|uniref:Transcriptional regulator, LytTR family n=2 Tax=Albimonas pacifica TaxID=1114924 RepID=A0A1I3HVQ9_9RHOB|nr:transcriptional regulator, LytTR family [Albimonas pacifica]